MKKLIHPTTCTCLLISWVLLCILATANQSQLPSQKLPHLLSNQTRIGFGLAGEYLNMEAKLTVQPSPGLVGNRGIDFSAKQSQTGKSFQIAPCIELGNMFENSYYLGLLVSWRYSSLKDSAKSTIVETQHFQHEFTLKHYTDILIKAGYQLTPRTMVYGLIGPSLARWTQISTQLEDNQAIVNKFSTNKMAIGAGFGVGLEYFVHKNYAFSIDYTHHFYRPTSKNQPMSYEAPNFGIPPTITRSGDLNRKINLSHATIAVRFTMFFQL